MIPKYDELMLPLLKLLSDGKERSIRECVEELANEFRLTDEERNTLLPSGRQALFENRVNWARTYLAKARLIESPKRGYVRIAERGKEVLAGSPQRIDAQYLMRFKEFQEFYRPRNEEQGTSASSLELKTLEESRTPEELIDDQVEILKKSLKDELMEKLRVSSPQFFERLVIDLIVKMGYGGSYEEVSQHLGKTGDEGIDGVIKQDPLGVDNIYIQAKRWFLGTVGRPVVQAFVGALHGKGARKGIFITTSRFSSEAIEYVNSLKDMTIVLIDGDKLLDYMIQYNVGVQVYKTLELKKIDFDYFEG